MTSKALKPINFRRKPNPGEWSPTHVVCDTSDNPIGSHSHPDHPYYVMACEHGYGKDCRGQNIGTSHEDFLLFYTFEEFNKKTLNSAGFVDSELSLISGSYYLDTRLFHGVIEEIKTRDYENPVAILARPSPHRKACIDMFFKLGLSREGTKKLLDHHYPNTKKSTSAWLNEHYQETFEEIAELTKFYGPLQTRAIEELTTSTIKTAPSDHRIFKRLMDQNEIVGGLVTLFQESQEDAERIIGADLLNQITRDRNDPMIWPIIQFARRLLDNIIDSKGNQLQSMRDVRSFLHGEEVRQESEKEQKKDGQ